MPIRHHAAIPSLVIAPHTPNYTQFMKVKAGEIVTVGKEDDEYPGWLWCTDSRGIANWAPKALLKFGDSPFDSAQGDLVGTGTVETGSTEVGRIETGGVEAGSAEVGNENPVTTPSSFQRKLESRILRAEFTADYDATELTVQIGETVTIYSEQSGWLWCLTPAGKWGWIPKECVAR